MTNPSRKRKIRTDIYSKKKRSEIMGAIKGKDTLLEVKFRQLLRKAGLRFGFNAIRLPGKPDIVFRKKELAIFIDGCFWHGCKKHFKVPKTNQFFWEEKIAGNVRRDLQINKFYKQEGWKVIRIWEHQIKTDPETIINKIKFFIESKNK